MTKGQEQFWKALATPADHRTPSERLSDDLTELLREEIDRKILRQLITLNYANRPSR